VFVTLFDDSGRARDAEIVNDIENNVEEEEKRRRPKRNAPMPTRYIQRIYAITNGDNIDVCYRGDFQEVMGFGADEVRPEGDDVESRDSDKMEQVELATFVAARLQLPIPGEAGMTIGKTRGALRGM